MKHGDRVELVSTTDPYTSLTPGDRGTVSHVDAVGTIHILWDNRSTLGMVPGEDVIKLICGYERCYYAGQEIDEKHRHTYLN